MTNQKNSEMANLPEDLAEKAVILSGEPAWKKSDALSLINHLNSEKLAVVGVEYWHQVQQKPKWLATSNYVCDIKEGWENYVQCCANKCIDFINKFGDDSDAIFNLTWISEVEYSTLRN